MWYLENIQNFWEDNFPKLFAISVKNNSKYELKVHKMKILLKIYSIIFHNLLKFLKHFSNVSKFLHLFVTKFSKIFFKNKRRK